MKRNKVKMILDWDQNVMMIKYFIFKTMKTHIIPKENKTSKTQFCGFEVEILAHQVRVKSMTHSKNNKLFSNKS